MNQVIWNEMLVDLYRRYGHSSRHYHGLNHMEECFAELKELLRLGLVEDEDAMRLAIWFHDYYQDHEKDEERSSLKGFEAADKLGHPKEFSEKVARLILVTKHGVYLPETSDEKYLCDIDLSPLADNNFAGRTAQVRLEYPEVPDDVFYPARGVILKGFLDRADSGKTIYYTEHFQKFYEEKAKANLRHAIATVFN